MADPDGPGPESVGPGFELPPFLDWLTARLCADPVIGPRAWLDGAVPQDALLPFVVFSVASSPDGIYSGGFVGHTRPLMAVKAVGRLDDLDEIGALAGAINRQCGQVGAVTLEAIAIRGSHRETPIYYTDERQAGGTVVTTLNVGGRYRFFVQSFPE